MINRIHKNRFFTVMGLYHLRDNRLSAKAKGIMSVVLSLPDKWYFCQNGIISLFGKDGERSILSGIEELKQCGYLRIDKVMPNEKNGKYSYIYNWYEKPNPFNKSDFLINFEAENETLKPNQDLQNVGLDNGKSTQNMASRPTLCSPTKCRPISNIDKEILNITTTTEERELTYSKLDEYIPACNTVWIQAVDKYLEKLPYKLVIRAIQETAEANKRDCRYFKAICERWILENYKTLEEVENDKNAYQLKKQKSQELRDKARAVYIEKNSPKAAKVKKAFDDMDLYIDMFEGKDNGKITGNGNSSIIPGSIS